MSPGHRIRPAPAVSTRHALAQRQNRPDHSIFMRHAGHPCSASTVLTEPPGELHGNLFRRVGADVLTAQSDSSRIELLEWFAGALGEVDVIRDLGMAAAARRAAHARRCHPVRRGESGPGIARPGCPGCGRPMPSAAALWLLTLLVIRSLTYTTVPRRPQPSGAPDTSESPDSPGRFSP